MSQSGAKGTTHGRQVQESYHPGKRHCHLCWPTTYRQRSSGIIRTRFVSRCKSNRPHRSFLRAREKRRCCKCFRADRGREKENSAQETWTAEEEITPAGVTTESAIRFSNRFSGISLDAGEGLREMPGTHFQPMPSDKRVNFQFAMSACELFWPGLPKRGWETGRRVCAFAARRNATHFVRAGSKTGLPAWGAINGMLFMGRNGP